MKANSTLLWLKTRIQDDTPACHAIKRKFSRISAFYVFKSVIHCNMSKNITLNALSATYVVVQSVFLWNLLIKRALAMKSSVIFHPQCRIFIILWYFTVSQCKFLLESSPRPPRSFVCPQVDHLDRIIFVC